VFRRDYGVTVAQLDQTLRYGTSNVAELC